MCVYRGKRYIWGWLYIHVYNRGSCSVKGGMRRPNYITGINNLPALSSFVDSHQLFLKWFSLKHPQSFHCCAWVKFAIAFCDLIVEIKVDCSTIDIEDVNKGSTCRSSRLLCEHPLRSYQPPQVGHCDPLVNSGIANVSWHMSARFGDGNQATQVWVQFGWDHLWRAQSK